MTILETLLEIHQYSDEGYKPLIDYGEWRVAILRFISELLPENISKMQRHDQTDEVFVLLKGRCIIFLGEGVEHVSEIYAQDMEPLKLYNVKKSCWHTHTLSKDAVVLIVENRDTVKDNSPEIDLSPEHMAALNSLTKRIWK
jgi:hypothetical protein